jgi:hypothetical protein
VEGLAEVGEVWASRAYGGSATRSALVIRSSDAPLELNEASSPSAVRQLSSRLRRSLRPLPWAGASAAVETSRALRARPVSSRSSLRLERRGEAGGGRRGLISARSTGSVYRAVSPTDASPMRNANVSSKSTSLVPVLRVLTGRSLTGSRSSSSSGRVARLKANVSLSGSTSPSELNMLAPLRGRPLGLNGRRNESSPAPKTESTDSARDGARSCTKRYVGKPESIDVRHSSTEIESDESEWASASVARSMRSSWNESDRNESSGEPWGDAEIGKSGTAWSGENMRSPRPGRPPMLTEKELSADDRCERCRAQSGRPVARGIRETDDRDESAESVEPLRPCRWPFHLYGRVWLKSEIGGPAVTMEGASPASEMLATDELRPCTRLAPGADGAWNEKVEAMLLTESVWPWRAWPFR